MSEIWWDGATWVYHADILNDGANSGNHVYALTLGEGDEMIILYGNALNGDAAGRIATLEIEDDDADRISRFFSRTLGVGGVGSFPYAEDDFESGLAAGTRFIFSGPMVLRLTVAAVAVAQDTALGIAARIRGGRPTVTLTSPTGATETVNKNRTY
ncbi:MAG: hypothetical protein LN413_05700 [Candidatus Thermoplasmatota archaeon]|nr:hypothetical protein [Candidatus Thermoplasmatota archaeon]